LSPTQGRSRLAIIRSYATYGQVPKTPSMSALLPTGSEWQQEGCASARGKVPASRSRGSAKHFQQALQHQAPSAQKDSSRRSRTR
jgi:hypothetical protein